MNDSNKKVILVDPNATEIIQTYFENFHENFLPIEQYFGHEDYEKVNEEIKITLTEIENILKISLGRIDKLLINN